MTPEESRVLNRIIFEKLAEDDPLKSLPAKIKINRFTAEQCRKDGSPKLGAAFDALVAEDEALLARLRAERGCPPEESE